MSEIIGAGGAAAGGQLGGQAGADVVKDVTVETFEAEVINASMNIPVIVDFWADWCGPCKQLAPVLEKVVSAAGGKVRLVKIDIDKNQMLASQLRIQSIPTVYAFFQGRPVDGFQGALPESEITAFVERLTEAAGVGAEQNNPGEDYIAAGQAAFDSGDVASAAQFFAQAAQVDPTDATALAGLARCQLALGEAEQARQTLALVPNDKENDPAVASVRAALELAEAGAGGGDLATLQAAADASPDNLEARFELANGQLGAGQMEQAIETLLAIIERDQSWNEEAARKKLITVFEALGYAHPASARGRRRLSSLLFS